jgi:hypothetical protein
MRGERKDPKRAIEEIAAMEALVAALDRGHRDFAEALREWRAGLGRRVK